VTGDPVLTELREDDANVFWPWHRDHLAWHIRRWSEAWHLGWDEADIAARIRDGRLIEKEWTELLAAADGDDTLVRVLRDGEQPIGAIYAEIRTDPYMGLPLGVLSWLHVDEAARGRRLSEPLVKAALAWWAQRGVPIAQVYVTAGNDAAIKAYAKGGFEIIDHRMLVGIRRR